MSEQEFEDFRRTMSLAQAALKAAAKRDEDQRKAKSREDDDSVHHYRFK